MAASVNSGRADEAGECIARPAVALGSLTYTSGYRRTRKAQEQPVRVQHDRRYFCLGLCKGEAPS